MNVTEKLINENKTISFMESCTSGLLASMLTDTEGASKIFFGSSVTYSNDSKVECGVNPEIIEKYGVYSKECAKDMARAAKEKYGTDLAVGITGNTGNIDPANPEGVTGQAFFSIVIGEIYFDYQIKSSVNNMSRREIKQFYADKVFEALNELL